MSGTQAEREFLTRLGLGGAGQNKLAPGAQPLEAGPVQFGRVAEDEEDDLALVSDVLRGLADVIEDQRRIPQSRRVDHEDDA